MEEALDIIPLGLFLLGVVFLLIGWRWQSPRSEENLTVFKGLAYLRSEILRVQDRVHVLEDEVLKTKLLYNSGENKPVVVDNKDLDIKANNEKVAVSKELQDQKTGLKKLEHQEIGLKEPEHQEIKLNGVGPGKVELKKVGLNGAEPIQKARIYSISPQEQRERSNTAAKRRLDEKAESRLRASNDAPLADHHISGKFREVIELAAQGQRIPEISQRLLISQDAVRMVLSMQSKGGVR
ncbi:MAG: hypothetical protein VR66_01425 [Peptococcaceae bacterium BRH_c23]|nr:MAG: hypothetical protein VR66_01425 [Peptococcaceae bacterium BRH_c23]KJS78696.1 MAG: hypothetical protein JL57_31015 [Desulfosporosinus sp. BICA1-9]HBW36024.1 hypothetical protein [Desulfosporosinus sp.]